MEILLNKLLNIQISDLLKLRGITESPLEGFSDYLD